jgi:hypothetical protein
MTFNEYENEPTFFIPKKIFYSDEKELTDEFCRWCCPNSFESNKCDEGRCIEFEEHMEKYTMTYDVDKDAIERLIIQLQEERDHYKLQIAEILKKLRWIPVSEGYPKKEGEYELKIIDWIEIGFYDESKLCKAAWIERGVTHYREIPELEDGE